MLFFSRFTISGHSMEPTLWQGQTVLASSIPYLFSKPKIGDIVLIRHSGNPDLSEASKISSQNLQRVRRFWTRRVPDGNPSSQNDEGSRFFIKRITKIDGEKYFVSGDNEKDSMDSRRFGWIEKKDILGKVIYRIA